MTIAFLCSNEHFNDEQNRLDAIERCYPYNFADACNSYGGCAFTTLCQASDPEAFFSNYHRYRWNPLAKQPIEDITNA